MTSSTANPSLDLVAPAATVAGLVPDDPRAVFGSAVALGTAVVALVGRDDLDRPTPCADLDGRGLLAHLVIVLDRVAALGEGGDPMAVAPRTGVADDGWLAAWLDAAHRVQRAWTDDAVLARVMRLPWAELPGAAILAGYTSEVTVHTWDLAVTIGTRPAWDARVLAVAFDAITRLLPVAARDGAAPFADAVPVPDGAPLVERLVAWTGRDPGRVPGSTAGSRSRGGPSRGSTSRRRA